MKTRGASVKSGTKVRSGLKGGRLSANDNQTVSNAGIKVRSSIKGGKLSANENTTLAKTKDERLIHEWIAQGRRQSKEE